MTGKFFQIFCHKKFSNEGRTFRECIARLAKKLATEISDPQNLESFVACKLIPLDKCPGIRPIGIGETLRRVVGKVISWVVKTDAMIAAGPLQVAAGIKSGAEGTIHAIRELFEEDDDSEALILIDAQNAFNSMNRAAALHNIQIICPEVSTYVINTYRSPPRLIIKGDKNIGDEISSFEGTTQGDNLGMTFYCLGILPILRNLKTLIDSDNLTLKQAWLADDACAVGKLEHIRVWFDNLIKLGVKYGYYINESKSWLIIKDRELLDTAKAVFAGTDVQFTTEGKRHLGACVGSSNFKNKYCSDMVSKWCKEVELLAEIAKFHPHSAYCGYVNGYQHKYTYYFRTIPGFEEYVKPLDDILTYVFIPTLFGGPISKVERELIALPTRYGGLGIHELAEKAPRDFTASKTITGKLSSVIKAQENCVPNDSKHLISIIKQSNEDYYQKQVESIKRRVSPQVKRAIEIGNEKGSSNWLIALPLEAQGFVLNRTEFTDALNLRYYREIKGLPSSCACGAQFNITHALNCKKGGFIHMRHDNLRDLNAKLLAKVQNDVEVEPKLLPIPNNVAARGNVSEEARLDVRARGFWRPAQNAFFDVRVTNPFCATSMKSSLARVHDNHEREKKLHYNYRVMNIDQGTFTPLIYTVFGTVGKECDKYYKHLCQKIADKQNERYSNIIN